MYVHSFSYLVNKLELGGYTYLQLKKTNDRNAWCDLECTQKHVFCNFLRIRVFCSHTAAVSLTLFKHLK